MAHNRLGDNYDLFTFHLFSDGIETGNMEWLEFSDKTLTGEGREIFSRQKSGKWPNEDEETWNSFVESLVN